MTLPPDPEDSPQKHPPAPDPSDGAENPSAFGAGEVRPFLRYAASPAADRSPPGDHTAALRPFVLTSGRVAGADPNIGMETQVTVHPGAAPARLPPEQRAIVNLCVEPLSVAEISAGSGCTWVSPASSWAICGRPDSSTFTSCTRTSLIPRPSCE